MVANEQTEEIKYRLYQSVRTAICEALHSSNLPPITVMSFAAAAVGSAYKEIADAHCGTAPCPCGWHPSRTEDVQLMQAMLAEVAETLAVTDLRIVQIAGRA